ncbi:response regulator [Halomicroarcula sp. F13]|uniref:Response regulator n=1 Tax=Haloarcula rubra TaxID=2487747 RepID=A0AAW4Q0R5_9EURY|nr:response regulator [Halomicroarcula rubra]MBX0325942.1 response regulator [Halomicroarcula rubra]
MSDPRPSVLLVEDEPPLREAYSRVLSQSYDVSTAATGEAAIDRLTDEIDVVLLDRTLPDADGEDLLREVQSRTDHCYVAMVTAIEPDFDIIDMGVDDYLVKPVPTEAVQETVERLLSLAEYDETYRDLSQKRVKRSVLAQEKSPPELGESEEFRRLQAEIDRLEAELDEIADECEGVERDLEQ